MQIGDKVKFKYKGEEVKGKIVSIYNGGDTANISDDKAVYTMPIFMLKEVEQKKTTDFFSKWNEVINGGDSLF